MTKEKWISELNHLVSVSTAARICEYKSRQAFAYALATLAGPAKIMIDGHPFLDRRELAAWNKMHKRKLKPPAGTSSK